LEPAGKGVQETPVRRVNTQMASLKKEEAEEAFRGGCTSIYIRKHRCKKKKRGWSSLGGPSKRAEAEGSS